MSKEKKAIIAFTIWLGTLQDMDKKDIPEDLKKVFDKIDVLTFDEQEKDDEMTHGEIISPLIDYFLEKVYVEELKELVT